MISIPIVVDLLMTKEGLKLICESSACIPPPLVFENETALYSRFPTEESLKYFLVKSFGLDVSGRTLTWDIKGLDFDQAAVDQWTRYVAQKKFMVIYPAGEADRDEKNQFVVAPADDADFWMGGYASREHAERFCVRNGLDFSHVDVMPEVCSSSSDLAM